MNHFAGLNVLGEHNTLPPAGRWAYLLMLFLEVVREIRIFKLYPTLCELIKQYTSILHKVNLFLVKN